MPTETRSKSWSKTNQLRRVKLLNEVCKELHYALLMSPTGKMPYGEVAKIIKGLKEDNPWLNRNVVNFAFKKFQAKKKKNAALMEDGKSVGTSRTECSSPSVTPKPSVGRPKGLTNLVKYHMKEVFMAAKNEITSEYHQEKQKKHAKGEKLPDGWLKNKISSVCNKRGIPDYASQISLSTIQSRTKAIVLQGGGSESLMAPVEPHLVELICAMASIRRCLSSSECIALANDLIAGTELESTIIK